MIDWKITLTVTTPYALKQETAQELWAAGDRFTSLVGLHACSGSC